MNKAAIVGSILFFGSMIVGCANENLSSKNELMDSYISLVNSKKEDLDISNIEERLKEYDFLEDSYYTLNSENNTITDNVKVYSFKGDSSEIALEFRSDNQIDLNYLANDSSSLLKSIRVNKDSDFKNNIVEVDFDSIEDRDEVLKKLKNKNIYSDSYDMYKEIERFIANNQNASVDDIQSEFSIKFDLNKRNDGCMEYIYAKDDSIKLIYDEASMKFIAIEYDYNGNKLYYTRFNDPNSNEIQGGIGIKLNVESTDINNILNVFTF